MEMKIFIFVLTGAVLQTVLGVKSSVEVKYHQEISEPLPTLENIKIASPYSRVSGKSELKKHSNESVEKSPTSDFKSTVSGVTESPVYETTQTSVAETLVKPLTDAELNLTEVTSETISESSKVQVTEIPKLPTSKFREIPSSKLLDLPSSKNAKLPSSKIPVSKNVDHLISLPTKITKSPALNNSKSPVSKLLESKISKFQTPKTIKLAPKSDLHTKDSLKVNATGISRHLVTVTPPLTIDNGATKVIESGGTKDSNQLKAIKMEIHPFKPRRKAEVIQIEPSLIVKNYNDNSKSSKVANNTKKNKGMEHLKQQLSLEPKRKPVFFLPKKNSSADLIRKEVVAAEIKPNKLQPTYKIQKSDDSGKELKNSSVRFRRPTGTSAKKKRMPPSFENENERKRIPRRKFSRPKQIQEENSGRSKFGDVESLKPKYEETKRVAPFRRIFEEKKQAGSLRPVHKASKFSDSSRSRYEQGETDIFREKFKDNWKGRGTGRPTYDDYEETEPFPRRYEEYKETGPFTPRYVEHKETGQFTPRYEEHKETGPFTPRYEEHKKTGPFTPRYEEHKKTGPFTPRYEEHKKTGPFTPRYEEHKKTGPFTSRYEEHKEIGRITQRHNENKETDPFTHRNEKDKNTGSFRYKYEENRKTISFKPKQEETVSFRSTYEPNKRIGSHRFRYDSSRPRYDENEGKISFKSVSDKVIKTSSLRSGYDHNKASIRPQYEENNKRSSFNPKLEEFKEYSTSTKFDDEETSQLRPQYGTNVKGTKYEKTGGTGSYVIEREAHRESGSFQPKKEQNQNSFPLISSAYQNYASRKFYDDRYLHPTVNKDEVFSDVSLELDVDVGVGTNNPTDSQTYRKNYISTQTVHNSEIINSLSNPAKQSKEQSNNRFEEIKNDDNRFNRNVDNITPHAPNNDSYERKVLKSYPVSENSDSQHSFSVENKNQINVPTKFPERYGKSFQYNTETKENPPVQKIRNERKSVSSVYFNWQPEAKAEPKQNSPEEIDPETDLSKPFYPYIHLGNNKPPPVFKFEQNLKVKPDIFEEVLVNSPPNIQQTVNKQIPGSITKFNQQSIQGTAHDTVGYHPTPAEKQGKSLDSNSFSKTSVPSAVSDYKHSKVSHNPDQKHTIPSVSITDPYANKQPLVNEEPFTNPLIALKQIQPIVNADRNPLVSLTAKQHIANDQQYPSVVQNIKQPIVNVDSYPHPSVDSTIKQAFESYPHPSVGSTTKQASESYPRSSVGLEAVQPIENVNSHQPFIMHTKQHSVTHEKSSIPSNIPTNNPPVTKAIVLNSKPDTIIEQKINSELPKKTVNGNDQLQPTLERLLPNQNAFPETKLKDLFNIKPLPKYPPQSFSASDYIGHPIPQIPGLNNLGIYNNFAGLSNTPQQKFDPFNPQQGNVNSFPNFQLGIPQNSNSQFSFQPKLDNSFIQLYLNQLKNIPASVGSSLNLPPIG